MGDESIIGKTFAGRFEVEALIEEGGMGRVYRARQVAMDRPVALKVLIPELARDEELIGRFLREMKATTRIEHPNSVRVYDYGTSDDGQLFLAMEFLEGRSLEEVITDDAPLAPARTAHLARQIARALGAAHEQNIVHRDLKPENVMVLDRFGQSDWIKVLDFGLAKLRESADDETLTAAGIRVGTPMYMAPEYIQQFEVDHRGDLYALGVLMYQMATGRPPFVGRPYELLSKHVTEVPDPPSKYAPCPRWLEEIILQLLEKDPAKRPARASDVVAWLERWSPEGTAADVHVEKTAEVGRDEAEGARRADPPPRPPAPRKVAPPVADGPSPQLVAGLVVVVFLAAILVGFLGTAVLLLFVLR